ncbi:MAG: SNF2-related protein, partial [Planctomycetota bacterium]
ARAAFELSESLSEGSFRVALSGTPVENRLDELWSVFRFTHPGLLGTRADFSKRYGRPINDGNNEAAENLRQLIKPFLLRRMKREVAKDLPPRTDVVLTVELDERERGLGFLASQATQFFNMDLGYYIDGWSNGWLDRDGGWDVLRNLGFYATSPFFLAWFSSWHGHTQWAKKYRLTDGGHFDNLGIYALVRRGCRLIIASDAGADPNTNVWDSSDAKTKGATFEDLRTLEQKLVADFGAELVIEWKEFKVSARDEAAEEAQQPDYKDRPLLTIFRGIIHNLPVQQQDNYSAKDPVVILFVKAAKNLKERLRQSATFIDKEKAETPTFPHESTGQQFYSEQKVLAYRALARDMIRSHKVKILKEIAGVRDRCSSGLCTEIKSGESSSKDSSGETPATK